MRTNKTTTEKMAEYRELVHNLNRLPENKWGTTKAAHMTERLDALTDWLIAHNAL